MTKRNPRPVIIMTLAHIVGASTANAAKERWECCKGSICDPKKDEIAVKLIATGSSRSAGTA